MAQTQSQKKLTRAIKTCGLTEPWKNLDKTIAYDPNKHTYPLRIGTMPTSVKLFQPILAAAAIYGSGGAYAESLGIDFPFRLIEQRGANKATFCELGLDDSSSYVVRATPDSIQINSVERDCTVTPSLPFKNVSDKALTAIMLALFPHLLAIDKLEGNEKIRCAIETLGKEMDNAITYGIPWTDKTVIPDEAKDAAYMLDAVMSVLENKLTLDCSEETGDTPPRN